MAFAVSSLVATDLSGLALPHADSRPMASQSRRASRATATAGREFVSHTQATSSEPLPSQFASSSSHHDPWLTVSREPSPMSISSLKATGLQEAPQFAPSKADGRQSARLSVDGDGTVDGILSIPTTSGEVPVVGGKASSAEYNQRMKRAMANPYEYHHHLGMYYTRMEPLLIVGSQPQSPEDIRRLKHDEGVGAVLNLQQDHDAHYWGIDLHAIRQHCEELGVAHLRCPARDFDPHSLRSQLPAMVSLIHACTEAGHSVYVHCTAGLGRAPAAAIAFLYWFRDMDLKAAYEHVTSRRPCGPKWDAIRGATYDLANHHPPHHRPLLEHLPQCAFVDVSKQERELIQHRVRVMAAAAAATHK